MEGHEGHALAGAERLFLEVDVPVVWMEWEHVKGRSDGFGGRRIIDFMARNAHRPAHLFTLRPLHPDYWRSWPFSILWVKDGFLDKRAETLKTAV